MKRCPPFAAALCAAALLAATPPAAQAVDAAVVGKTPASPDQPRPRTGRYKVVQRGPTFTRARCLEGGNVVVPTREKATAAERAHDIHEACKTVDYTK